METQKNSLICPQRRVKSVGEPRFELGFAENGACGGGCSAWLLVLRQSPELGQWMDLNGSRFQSIKESNQADWLQQSPRAEPRSLGYDWCTQQDLRSLKGKLPLGLCLLLVLSLRKRSGSPSWGDGESLDLLVPVCPLELGPHATLTRQHSATFRTLWAHVGCEAAGSPKDPVGGRLLRDPPLPVSWS